MVMLTCLIINMKYLSLYGYVYMVKHKHDILEMFKDTQIKVRK